MDIWEISLSCPSFMQKAGSLEKRFSGSGWRLRLPRLARKSLKCLFFGSSPLCDIVASGEEIHFIVHEQFADCDSGTFKFLSRKGRRVARRISERRKPLVLLLGAIRLKTRPPVTLLNKNGRAGSFTGIWKTTSPGFRRLWLS